MTDDPTAPAGGFRNILVVCDGTGHTEALLERAIDLAAGRNAKLTLLSVADRASEIDQLARHTRTEPATIAAGLEEELRAPIAALAAGQGADIDIVVRLGRPFRVIIDDVIANGRDLVIKGAQTFEGARSFLFTSTDQHLLRKCPCPVWLVMPDTARKARTIIAAVDLDDEDDPAIQDGLNRTIVQTALAIADRENATVHVTHVWEAPAEDMIRRWTDSDDEVFRYSQTIEARRRSALDELIANTSGGTATGGRTKLMPRLLRGLAHEQIPDHVRAIGADLLVMGTLARTGVPGLIIGNTAEDVLNAVDCSVLTVKPPGYVSPLASA